MEYPGKELEIFDKAHLWRGYLYLVLKKFIGKKILEVGAGIGSFTKIYLKENSNNETIFIFDIAEEYVSAKDVNRYFKKIKFIKKYSKKQKQTRLICTKLIDKTNL